MKMKRNYKEVTKDINLVKKEYNYKDLYISELTRVFKQHNIPIHNRFMYKFLDKCMDKCGKGFYRFKYSEPIYYKVIESIFLEINNQNKNNLNKQIENNLNNQIEILDKEQEAIKYLKSLGYKIFRTTLEEI